MNEIDRRMVQHDEVDGASELPFEGSFHVESQRPEPGQLLATVQNPNIHVAVWTRLPPGRASKQVHGRWPHRIGLEMGA